MKFLTVIPFICLFNYQDINPSINKDFLTTKSHMDQNVIRSYVEYLSSDELMGRFGGSKHEHMAAEYISEIFRKAGLKPVGDKDSGGNPTYYQHFDLYGKITTLLSDEEKQKLGRSKNCLGLLEGTDPNLKNEHIVVGAHYDHIGNMDDSYSYLKRIGSKSEDTDIIFNGADDNASGTSLILMLANALGKSGMKFKRSILFMTFGAEEMGLLGSKYYVNNPVIPLNQTILMFNTDMPGGNIGKPIVVRGYGSEDGNYLETLVKKSVEETGVEARFGDDVGDRSDQASFFYKDIPVLSMGAGMTPLYNTVKDEADQIDYPRMAKSAEVILRVLYDIANKDIKPRFNHDFKAKKLENKNKDSRPTIGFYPDLNIEREDLLEKGLQVSYGGITVAQVVQGSFAEKIGLIAGDIIFKVRGIELETRDPVEHFKQLIKYMKAGRELTLSVIRSSETLELKGIWEPK